MCNVTKNRLLGKLPLDPNLLLSCENGKSITKTHPSSKCTEAYKKLVKKIYEVVGDEGGTDIIEHEDVEEEPYDIGKMEIEENKPS